MAQKGQGNRSLIGTEEMKTDSTKNPKWDKFGQVALEREREREVCDEGCDQSSHSPKMLFNSSVSRIESGR